ncbi:MAG: gamma-glutamyl-gamma-aminobutyrate hydrolase family protein, partial [Bdellovibrionales bacterium]|nr:gamma-glutamyl-gamma-aminobutyrate hydrolase family protein [Bdellovibrionales bacterium]
DSDIPFLILRTSFENSFYYFNRFKLSISDLKFIPFKSNPHQIKIALIANSFEDMRLGTRLIRDFNLLKQNQAEVFIIPVGYDWNLTEEEALFYRKFIAEHFDLLISLGGDDVHPSLYDQPNINSKNVNYDRDLSEFNLIKYFKAHSQGVFFGICRGHQLSAVVDGYQLVQDLGEIHSSCLTKHQKNIDNKPEYLFHEILIKPSLLSRLLGFKDKIEKVVSVNSYHHQAVKNNNLSQKICCVAFDTEHDIIEALITNEGKSISVQFHPELPEEMNKNAEFTEFGYKFIRRVISYSRLNRFRNKKQTPAINTNSPQEFVLSKLKANGS